LTSAAGGAIVARGGGQEARVGEIIDLCHYPDADVPLDSGRISDETTRRSSLACSNAEYQAKLKVAADQLVADRLLTPIDAAIIVQSRLAHRND
jgi:hypothetical protein